MHDDSFFPSIDQIIAPLTKEEQMGLQPEILLTFGGMIVSKKIKSFLRKYQPKHHWHVDKKKAYDTFFCLSMHVDYISHSGDDLLVVNAARVSFHKNKEVPLDLLHKSFIYRFNPLYPYLS